MPDSLAAQYPKIYLYRRVVQAKLFIDEHHAQSLNLGNIANEAYFSKFHFIRLFKATYGKTPHQYLMAVRINRAQVLLKQGMPVTEVCYAIGFDSISSFSALFKRITKLSPSAWQQKELQRDAEMKSKPRNFIPNCFAEMNGW
ncbi:helix-turn-helix domain-containing protein [Mucilaginibacter pedocola]|uniref:AraC family transcriptional regulator n=1 Tax=Mucilaginibacter pedocola TaxID=1792845 RepID=A0A1S9PLE3_9SPHI|nr:AraC family transcriptional regulator [Mucilaginibacter pedocola]OOQ61783.1 AraC family transcriptional regulator [Mucilaginibacter pedocola]